MVSLYLLCFSIFIIQIFMVIVFRYMLNSYRKYFDDNIIKSYETMLNEVYEIYLHIFEYKIFIQDNYASFKDLEKMQKNIDSKINDISKIKYI